MSEIDDATVMAWADGELDEVTRRRIERAATSDPVLSGRMEAQRQLRERLSTHYARVAEETVPDSLRALVEGDHVVAPMKGREPLRWRGWATGGAIAASLLIGLTVGRVTGGDAGPISAGDRGMIAQGPLAAALDTQLASAQGDTPYRIGLSFRRKGGGWCRSFDGAALAGVACREGERWQLQQVVPGSGDAAGYRQASSGDARIMATVDAMIADQPADATQERAARMAGWR
ncbi:MAG: anti-sigma factor [Sphingobium sp.]